MTAVLAVCPRSLPVEGRLVLRVSRLVKVTTPVRPDQAANYRHRATVPAQRRRAKLPLMLTVIGALLVAPDAPPVLPLCGSGCTRSGAARTACSG
jgi:hypothetical protein